MSADADDLLPQNFLGTSLSARECRLAVLDDLHLSSTFAFSSVSFCWLLVLPNSKFYELFFNVTTGRTLTLQLRRRDHPNGHLPSPRASDVSRRLPHRYRFHYVSEGVVDVVPPKACGEYTI